MPSDHNHAGIPCGESAGSARDPSPQTMDELLRSIDLMTPWAIRAAATLRLPDAISAGCNEVGELASKLGVDSEALARLMRFLGNIGVCRETAPHSFELGEMGRL